MRTILFTGKGGVGKTTAAAGTATWASRAGHRTLVLSTDAAHSLADTFGVAVGAEPVEVAPDLFVQQVDAQRRFERSWAEVQGYLLTVLDAAGQWRGQSGAVGREASKVMVIVLSGRPDDRARLDAVREAYRHRFRQEAVMLVERPACVAV